MSSSSEATVAVPAIHLPEPDAGQDRVTSARVYRALVQSIRDGALKAGDKLPNERTLSVQFATSRGTIRHALALMDNQGLVTRKVGSGTYLRDTAKQVLSETDLPVAAHHDDVPTYAEILEGRLLFEPAMMALSARRATDEDFALMQRYLTVIREAQRWIDFKEGIYGVHLAIFKATHNRFLIQVFDAVITDRRAVSYDGRTGVEGPVSEVVRQQTLRELTEIVDALTRRDAASAAQLAQDYFTRILASISLYG